jgi:alpha-L-fucosidase
VANLAEKSEAGQRRRDWWRDARFGMFIHWGPSSVASCEISWSKLYYDDIGENIKPNPRPGPGLMGKTEWSESWLDWFHPPVPREIYDNLPKSFYPGMFDADKIVAQAKATGSIGWANGSRPTASRSMAPPAALTNRATTGSAPGRTT